MKFGLTIIILHKVCPIHHTVRLWSHNGGSHRNTKDVQKEKRSGIQIQWPHECVAVLPTTRVHRVQGRMGGILGDFCACTWYKPYAPCATTDLHCNLAANEAMILKPSFEEIRLVDACSMRKTKGSHVVYV